MNYDIDHPGSFDKKEIFKYYQDEKKQFYQVDDEEEDAIAAPTGPSYGTETAIVCGALGVLVIICVCIANICGTSKLFVKRCETISSSELKNVKA